MPRIPVHAEMDRAYLRLYYTNWWRRLTGKSPIREYKGRCVGCGVRGVLGYDLIHRGVARPTNLICDGCLESGK